MKKTGMILLLLLSVLCLAGCQAGKLDDQKLRDIEFTVVDKDEIPEELQDEIEDAKSEEMKLSYGEKGYLYVVRGYGIQDTTGYSVEVNECYETENGIYIRTSLLGPGKEEKILNKKTCPYVVIKMEYIDKQIIYD